MTDALLAALIAYLTGALPIGLVLARVVKGVDIREHGSGNIGATNVGRVIGTKWGLVVLLLDALKGMLPCLLLPRAFDFGPVPHEQTLCGVAAIVGHMFPVYLGFKGGKGVATALGIAFVLGPYAALAAVLVFATLFWRTRTVSIASLCGAFAYLIVEMIVLLPAPFSHENWPLAVFAIAVPTLIVIRHRTNIVRLLQGIEAAYTDPADPVTSDVPSEPTSDDLEHPYSEKTDATS